MNQPVYRKTILIMLCIVIILLFAIAWKVGVFQNLTDESLFLLITSIVTNTWFCGTCCSIAAVFIVYKWQVWYSKKKLKADFRCSEVIDGVYSGIEAFHTFADNIPPEEKSNEDNYLVLRKKYAQTYVDFYENEKSAVFLANLAMTYEGNDLLLESIQSCFFINLNFKLLSIINHVKNRLLTLRKKYAEIEEIYERYEKNSNEEDLIKLGDILKSYFIDLGYMAEYWKELFDYLEYDPKFVRMFIQTYNTKYSIKDDIKLPVEIRNSQITEVEKQVRKAIRQDRWKHFWY